MKTYYINVYKDGIGVPWQSRESARFMRERVKTSTVYMIVVRMKK